MVDANRSIILATDLSSRCDRAMDRAAQLAALWTAKLVIVTVVEMPLGGRDRDAADAPSWRRSDLDRQRAAARVRRGIRETLNATEVAILEGDPAQAIATTAEANDADLIVAGIARDETLGRQLLGSTLERLAARTPTPLLVVKSRSSGYDEILIATDFSERSQAALTVASAFFPCARLTLLHAWGVPFPAFQDNQSYRADFLSEVRKRGDDFLKESCVSDGQRDSLKLLIEHGEIEVLVRSYMLENDVDLVVVGCQGTGDAFNRPLGGSAKRILSSAPGDVLLARGPHVGRER